MDRFQAVALGDLVTIERELRSREADLLSSYGAGLERRARFEGYFFVTVALILGAMFWYGRKLQRTYERMVADRQRAADERRERLLAVGEVCAAVAHGLRNPLASIVAAAQVAREEADDGPLAEALDDVLFEARRLEGRASRLLDFSRPLASKLQTVDVNTLLADVARGLQARSRRCGVQILLDAARKPRLARADADLLTEVIEELAANALEAMSSGGRLWLSSMVEREQVVIRVADDGPGIPAGVRDHVFEPFFTTNRDGTGLGLATVKKLIEIQDGRLVLESTGGDGTAFRVELPAA
jgi:signal transduction histidine kinase